MKRYLAVIICCLMILAMVGCADNAPGTVGVKTEDGVTCGKSAMVELGDGLWYDSNTWIVYWWNGSLYKNGERATTPSPYYAPNGLPYKYNPVTKELEMIE